MLQKIGRRAAGDDAVDLLVDCHQRIREFLTLAHDLAAAQAPPLAEVAVAAGRVRRYFTEALPRHVADEEYSLLPRLRGRSAELDAALAVMRAEHADHEAPVTQLLDLCAELEAAPAQHSALARSLGEVVAALHADLERHLETEERTIFPAVAALPDAERQAVVAEMRARRSARS